MNTSATSTDAPTDAIDRDKSQAAICPIEHATEHLHEAEHDLAKARELEAEASAEIAEAEREIEQALNDERDRPKVVEVFFKDLCEHESAHFDARLEATLQKIWDEAYAVLGIERGERDILQAPHHDGNPVSLMEHLGLTLAEAQDSKLCEDRFEIAARTGGA